MEDKFLSLKIRTIRDLLNWMEHNPEYFKFIDKPIVIHSTETGVWDAAPQIRLSIEHDQLVLEVDVEDRW